MESVKGGREKKNRKERGEEESEECCVDVPETALGQHGPVFGQVTLD